MLLTIIVTIDPVKELRLLNAAVHSLNLQTSDQFEVVFYNQRQQSEASILGALTTTPQFNFRFVNVPETAFWGNYPLWDIYALHASLIESDDVGDYLISLHMEEFLDVDYVESVLSTLDQNGFDILLGNLRRTRLGVEHVDRLASTAGRDEFDRCLNELGVKQAPHWGVRRKILRTYDPFRGRMDPGAEPSGYVRLDSYHVEDVFLMSRGFARKYNWFLRGHHMYFEDVHICQLPGVCELAEPLRRLTDFPVYFSHRNVYHLQHGKFYYQLEDDEFTSHLAGYETSEPALIALKEAARLYRSGRLGLQKALRYSRANAQGTGTQNQNFQLHMKYLRPHLPPPATGVGSV